MVIGYNLKSLKRIDLSGIGEEPRDPESRGRNSESGCKALDHGHWTLRLSTLDFGPSTLDLGLWTLDYGPWTDDSGLPTDDSALLALVGIVPMKVTDEGGPINPGDLLTTSSTPGYAMKWNAGEEGNCALVGKALESINGKKGVIKVLLMH